MLQADKQAIDGTNNGLLDWQEAHENWAYATREQLSPAAFARRIMDMGGGNNLKQREAPNTSSNHHEFARPDEIIKDKFHNRITSSTIMRNTTPGSPGTSSSGPNQMRGDIPQLPSNRSGPIGMDSRSLQDELYRQRSDISRMDNQMSQLQRSVESLQKLVESVMGQKAQSDKAALDRASDVESLDLVTETVSALTSKVGEIDGLKLILDSYKRRLRRLEARDGLEAPLNAKPTPPPNSASTGDERQRSEQFLSHVDPKGDTVSRLRLESPLPRKRGRPAKHAITSFGDIETMSSDHEVTPNEHVRAAEEIETNHTMDIDPGRIVRRGSGVSFGEYPHKRTRQKPTRMPDGTLLRKDGLPDKRSTSSAQNLKRVAEKKQQEREGNVAGMKAHEDMSATPGHGPREDSLEGSLTSASGQGGDIPARTASSLTRDHDSVMKQMFPGGLREEARRMDHAGNIFSSDGNPHQSKVQPRSEMQKEELAHSDQHVKRHDGIAKTVGNTDRFAYQPRANSAARDNSDVEMSNSAAASKASTFKPLNLLSNQMPQRTSETRSLAGIYEPQTSRDPPGGESVAT